MKVSASHRTKSAAPKGTNFKGSKKPKDMKKTFGPGKRKKSGTGY